MGYLSFWFHFTTLGRESQSGWCERQENQALINPRNGFQRFSLSSPVTTPAGFHPPQPDIGIKTLSYLRCFKSASGRQISR
jgi:hypothetical protein